ncbi:MAG: TIGR03790 family protein [Kiritimatiellae bacterium]|nr:TIGR03790 family protein [Kiritimatiellia bacterium]
MAGNKHTSPELTRTTAYRAFVLLGFLAGGLCAHAGGGPQNVLIVVNDQSIESLEIGQYYREQRGIPERNMCHISVDPALYDMTWSNFQTNVFNKIYQHISDHQLTNQIDYIVLCRGIASRVGDNEGATAVLFYGFKNAPKINPPSLPCSMPANTTNHYYKAERAFRHGDAYGNTNYYLSSLLTARTLALGRTSVIHGVSSDGTSPAGTFYLIESRDPARNVRYKLFDNFDFHARFVPDFPAYSIMITYEIIGKTDVLGHIQGRYLLPDFATNTYLPGAMGDLFTSFGGKLPDGAGHDTVWDWMEWGASASYGTVAEPCAYLEKFPDPMVDFWYARGFNMAESYWMSVHNPYQGIFAGDPLAAPFAFPPAVQITNLVADQVLSGSVDVDMVATTNSDGDICSSVDIYVDDLFVTNLVTVGPSSGNVLSATIGGVTCKYTAGSSDTLYDAVAGLAYDINASNLAVWAYAYGDRIMLVYTNYGQPGIGMVYSTTTATGGAAALTVWGQALSTNLLESNYEAMEYIQVSGTAKTGDVVRCIITLTNGTAVTNLVVAMQGESAAAVMDRLRQVINSNAALQAADGVFANRHADQAVSKISLDARTGGPQGHNLFVDYDVIPAPPPTGLDASDSFSDNFNDNESDLTARGNMLFWCGRDPLTATFSWDTTAWDDGPHTIRAVAKLGTATKVQGHCLLPIIVSNSALTCALTSPTNGQVFVLEDIVAVEATATNPAATVTQAVFLVEQKAFSTDSAPPYTTSWDTMDYGVGFVSLQVRAFDDAGNSTISEPTEVQVIMSPTLDTDNDDVGDLYEQTYFGGLDVYGNTNDPDGDGVSNYKEYVADTNPAEGTDFFALVIAEGTNKTIDVSFGSSTARQYESQFNDNFATNSDDWQIASPTSFWGTSGTHTWTDDGSETGIHPSSVLQRIYRMRVHLP